MKPIPNVLECHYCERNRTHGGSCFGKQGMPEKGCLGFKADERGCIRNKDARLIFPLYSELPKLNVWNNDFLVNGKDYEMRITKIYGIEWGARKGNLIVRCTIDYFVNDFADDYMPGKDKGEVKLRVIK